MPAEPPIKPLPLICEILPGFTVLTIICIAVLANNPSLIRGPLFQSNNFIAAVAVLGAGALLVSWVIGSFLDSCRDLSEWLVHRWIPVNWDFVFTGSAEDVSRINEWYLAYYFLNVNYAIGVFSVLALTWLRLVSIPSWEHGLLVFACLVFLLNSFSLRTEIIALIGAGPPHEGVYTRLRPSKVDPDGVGVFAIADIKKGTYLFEPDDDKMVWINGQRISELSREIRKLYHDFGPLKNGKYGVPTSLNKLTVAWYLNEPAPGTPPNVGCDATLKFYALADISAGDELTVEYGGYSETPPQE